MIYKVSLDKENKNKAQIFETIQGEGTFMGVPAFFIRLQGCSAGCYFCDEKETWLIKDFPPGIQKMLSDGSLENDRKKELKRNRNFCEMSADEIITELKRINPKLKRVVITGGEPTEQDLSDLLQKLFESGFDVHVETAATGKFCEKLFDFEKLWITFSPKEIYAKKAENGTPHKKIWQKCSEIKFVVSNENAAKYLFDQIIPNLNNHNRISNLHDCAKIEKGSEMQTIHKSCPIFLTPDWFDFEANKKRVLELLSEHPDYLRAGIQAHKYLEIN